MEESEFGDRLQALEARVAELEQQVLPKEGSDRPGRAAVGPLVLRSDTSAADDDTFWILNGLRDRLGRVGGVAFAGTVEVADGPVEWQYGATTEDVLAADWSELAADLAALGHPARLTLLQSVLGGAHTVAELSAADGMGSTGQLYHHLGQLSAHGWLTTVARGRYVVPAPRVVPLMVIITAARRIG